METNKKKTVKRVVFAVIVLLFAAMLVAQPFMMEARQGERSNVSTLSSTAQIGTIRKTLSGTGTITDQEAETVSVPDGVLVTEYLVSNGNFVEQGEPVARVDKISVMESISSLRETMSKKAEELESERSASGTGSLTAPASAKVKAVYASAGDSVREVMLEHGSLAVLSLDGLMSVSFPSLSDLSIGEEVTVILSDGKEVKGRVESDYDETVTVTISDSYGSIGEIVRIMDREGLTIGSGLLEVHSAWNAMGTDGTVSRVFISEGRTVYSGGTLFTLTGNSGGEGYAKLLSEYQDYEETMAELFQLYVDGVATAPCDGCVSGVDESILTELSSSQSGSIIRLALYGDSGSLQLLSDEQDSVTTESSVIRIGIITEVNSDEITVNMTDALAFEDENSFMLFLSSVISSPPVDSMNTPQVFPADAFPAAKTGNVYVFFYDAEGNIVQYYLIKESAESQEEPEQPSDDPVNPENPGENNGQTPSGGGNGQMPSGGGGFGGGSGGFSGTVPETQDESSAAVRTTVLSVTPQDTVTVSITVDELDILYVQIGQNVQVTLDALPGQSFTGMIKEVNTAASNDGGNSKYSAVVQLDRTAFMLGGMNASANIVVEERDGVLLIPSSALAEVDGQTVVYTAYDSKTESLSDPATVEIGLSDGNQVQILSGLKEGDTVWYEYYDKLEVEGLFGIN